MFSENSNEKSFSPEVEKLLEYERQGFLFHGSTDSNLKKLIPKEATSEDDETYNKSTAVYAAIHPSSACIISIIKRSVAKTDLTNLHFAVGSRKAKIPKVIKESLTEKGIVYITPPRHI